MISYRRIALVAVLMVLLLVHGMYSIYSASKAREALDMASDSIARLIDAREPMEVREDSLRSLVEEQREALTLDSIRWAQELDDANVRARDANVRATTLVDSIRVRVDSSTLELVDSLVVEHDKEVSALESQVEILKRETVALFEANASMTELMHLGDDIQASLRAEIEQQALGISELERLLTPPFSVRFLNSAKVGIPVLAVGVALGFVLSN